MVAVLGFINFQSIQSTLLEQITNSQAKLSSKIDHQIPDNVRDFITNNRNLVLGDEITSLQDYTESRLALLQLVIIASEMRSGDSFTDETRGAAVSLLEIISKNDEHVKSAQFLKPLEDIIDAFLGADQEIYIDNIDSKLRAIISERNGIALSMLQHYGLRIVGSVQSDKNSVERFIHYADIVTHSFNSPEAAAPFMLGYDFIVSGGERSAKGEEILQDAKYWEKAELETF